MIKIIFLFLSFALMAQHEVPDEMHKRPSPKASGTSNLFSVEQLNSDLKLFVEWNGHRQAGEQEENLGFN